MRITVNGKEKEIQESLNLENIIEQFCKDTRHIIAEVNGSIIRNINWKERTIAEGDTIELVNIVGGG